MNGKNHISKKLGKIFALCFCLAAMTIFLSSPTVLAMGGGGGGGGVGVGGLGAMTGFSYGNMANLGLMANYGGYMGGYGGYGGLMGGYGGYGGLMGGYGSTSSVNTAAMLGSFGGAGYGAGSAGVALMNQAAWMNQNGLMNQTGGQFYGNMYGNSYGMGNMFGNTDIDADADDFTRYMSGNMLKGGMGSGGQGSMWGTDPTMVPGNNAAGMLPNAINSQGMIGYMTGMGTGASFNTTGNVAAGFWGSNLGGTAAFIPLMNQNQYMNQYQYGMPW